MLLFDKMAALELQKTSQHSLFAYGESVSVDNEAKENYNNKFSEGS